MGGGGGGGAAVQSGGVSTGCAAGLVGVTAGHRRQAGLKDFSVFLGRRRRKNGAQSPKNIYLEARPTSFPRALSASLLVSTLSSAGGAAGQQLQRLVSHFTCGGWWQRPGLRSHVLPGFQWAWSRGSLDWVSHVLPGFTHERGSVLEFLPLNFEMGQWCCILRGLPGSPCVCVSFGPRSWPLGFSLMVGLSRSRGSRRAGLTFAWLWPDEEASPVVPGVGVQMM